MLSAPLPPPRDPALPYRVCLVCLGNICRSPMAETVLRDGLARAGLGGAVEVDSAGTGDWHVGGPMNPSARAALARRGYDGSAHRARQHELSGLARHDLLLAMDASNLASLRRLAGAADGARIRLFAEVAGGDGDIPDPYGGSAADFEHVLDLLAAATPLSRSPAPPALAPEGEPGRQPDRPADWAVRPRGAGGRVTARLPASDDHARRRPARVRQGPARRA